MTTKSSHLIADLLTYVGDMYSIDEGFLTKSGNLIVFDLFRKNKFKVDIVQVKDLPITVATIEDNFDVSFLEVIESRFPYHLVSVTYLSTEIGISSNELDGLNEGLPENICVKVQQIGGTFFREVYHRFLKQRRRDGYALASAKKEWESVQASRMPKKFLPRLG